MPLDASKPRLEIHAAREASTLTFEIVERAKHGTRFTCTLDKRGKFSGLVEADTYAAGPPSALFAEMAREWRGWGGTKIWQDIEDALTLKAASDATGHISLQIEMRSFDPRLERTSLVSSLMLEAGSLDSIARDVAELFRDNRSLEIIKGLVETEK